MSAYDEDLATLETWIINRRILVAVRYIDRFSIEEIELEGVYKTGYKPLDQAIHQQWCEFYSKPLEIVRMVCEGKPVKIKLEEDSKGLYELFNAYLLRWKSIAETGIHMGLVNAELMLKIDEFLTILFPFANRQQAQVQTNDIFNFAGFTRSAPVAPQPVLNFDEGLMAAYGIREAAPEAPLIAHQSAAEVFEQVAYQNHTRNKK
jgi:hypothetical protein